MSRMEIQQITDLANILLKETQSKSLMQPNLASMPDLLQLSMMSKHLKFNNNFNVHDN